MSYVISYNGAIATKAWGTTQRLFGGSNSEVHRIKIVRGGYCSIHHHIAKLNLFFVESGHLRVTTFLRDLQPMRSETLLSGESLTVEPGIVHQFEAIEPTVAYEICSAESLIDPEDIVRHSLGGVRT